MTRTKDDYGVLSGKLEAASDVNEDRNREEQLDDSFEAWYGNIRDQVKQKLDLTNVPQANGFDSAVSLEEDPSRIQNTVDMSPRDPCGFPGLLIIYERCPGKCNPPGRNYATVPLK